MSVWNEPWSQRRERRLRALVQQRLPAGEMVRHAAIVFDGAPPNLVGMGIDWAMARLLTRSRTYFTVALTDRRVVVFSNAGESSPSKTVAEFSPDAAIGEMSLVDGDNWVEVGAHRYWYWPNWKPQMQAMKDITVPT